MRVGAPGMATGAGAVEPPESGSGVRVALVGSGAEAIGAPRALVSDGGEDVAAGATRVSADAQAATSAKAGNSNRDRDGIGMGHLGRQDCLTGQHAPLRAVPVSRAGANRQFRLRLPLERHTPR